MFNFGQWINQNDLGFNSYSGINYNGTNCIKQIIPTESTIAINLNFNMLGYWKYYDDNFDWKIESLFLNPGPEYTVQKLHEQGLSKDNAIKLFNSGYVCFKGFNILIDKFYGGLLSSYEMRTRLPLSEAKSLITQLPKSLATFHKVQSIDGLNALIDTAEVRDRKIVFRGQNRNHFIEREIKNPYLTIQNYGEVSLMPSIWRKMYNVKPLSFLNLRH